MSDLVNYNKDGLELVIDTQTGEAFASISATARMVDKGESTIRAYLASQNLETKSAEVQTPGGIQGAQLLSEEQIVQVVTKYKPELLAKFAKLGVRVFLHQLAGYEVKSTAIEVKSVDQLTDLELSKIYLNRQVDRVAYNQTQANNAKACSEQYQKELSNQYDKTEEVGNLFATLRLRCEGDKSMNQIHLTNTIYKQKRQVQIITEGYDSVPYNLLTQPEKKQLAKLGKGCSAKHLLEANPSSKESELPNKFTTITIS